MSRLTAKNKVQVVAYSPTADVFHLNAISFLISVAKKIVMTCSRAGCSLALLADLAFLALPSWVALEQQVIAHGSHYYKPGTMPASVTFFCC